MSLQGEYNVVGWDQAVTRSMGNARIALGAGRGRSVPGVPSIRYYLAKMMIESM